jgi:oligosaccharyltransferase complex subunit alpha (ribophorin I)
VGLPFYQVLSMKNVLCLAAVLLAVSCVVLAAPESSPKGLVNTEIKRSIFLWSPVAKHEISISVTNEGSAAVTTYDLALNEASLKNMAQLVVTNNDAKVLPWKVEEQLRNIQGGAGELIARVALHRVTLSKPLGAGESMTLRVQMSFGNVLQPYPETISQAETQLVRFNDTHYLFSPYPTNKCTTTVKLASASIQTSSQMNPMKIDGDTITYGPYTNVPAYSLSPLVVHFESTQPFITAEKVVREIEVSHWGNVAVEDFAHLVNTGAKLKGGFSRYTYQMTAPTGHSAALRDLEITLPEGAMDVYYKDAIGNISTSHWSKRRLQLQPRYPLFGGWQTTFCTGYNLPIEKHLSVSKKSSNSFTLSFPIGPSYSGDVFVQNHIVKIILPEGASDIKVDAPFSMNQSFETRTTYLDVSGRPVVVLQATNLIADHLSKQIKVTYHFTSTDLLREPAMLIAGIFALFLIAIIASHISLEIMPEDAKVKEQRINQVIADTKRYVELLDQRLKIAKDLDTEANSATSNFQKHRQTAKEQIDARTQGIIKIIKTMEPLDSNTAETIRDIETLLAQKLKAQAELHAAILAKKVTDALKAAYVEADDEIDSLRKSLTQ